MYQQLIQNGLIPLDKSWAMRMGLLGLLDGDRSTTDFLQKSYDTLSDDLKALHGVYDAWHSGKPIDVGESGTLYRFLQFAAWKKGLDKTFIRRGTLATRQICNDPHIVNLPLEELLKLDNGTSQWASAAMLMGGDIKLTDDLPYKLKITYTALEVWRSTTDDALVDMYYDDTIYKQAWAFIELRNGRRPGFAPEHSEDYCFARAFGYISREEGEALWPSLKGHESNRLEEMDRALACFESGEAVDSNDHRIVQAIGMLQQIKGKSAKIRNPSAVNKSWPQFWRFLREYDGSWFSS